IFFTASPSFDPDNYKARSEGMGHKICAALVASERRKILGVAPATKHRAGIMSSRASSAEHRRERFQIALLLFLKSYSAPLFVLTHNRGANNVRTCNARDAWCVCVLCNA